MDYFYLEHTYTDNLKEFEKKIFLLRIKIIKYLFVYVSIINVEIYRHLKISTPESYSHLNKLNPDNLIENNTDKIKKRMVKPVCKHLQSAAENSLNSDFIWRKREA